MRPAPPPLPISERGILQSAKLLVDQHESDAPIRAAHRADELLAGGYMKGRVVWQGIVRAVEELTRWKPKQGDPVN